MFNLQQKYKKTFHKMQNRETSSLETPLRYQGRNGEPARSRGNPRRPHGGRTAPGRRALLAGLQPSALSARLGAPLGLGR